jgi:hypothetical protein
MATIADDAASESVGSNAMKPVCAKAVAAMLAVVGGSISVAPANAAPPTVTPSPGYDARLQESRARTVYAPVAPVSKPVTTRRAKRTNAP